jgi:hypothetical protein
MITLRDYQQHGAQEAVRILNELGIVYFVWEVRTGKTLTALSAADMYGAKKVLFITKKRAIDSRTILNDYEALAPGFEMQLINKESLHKITDNDFDLVISDEHHATASAYPKANKSAKDLKQRFGRLPMIFLSGTPAIESGSQWYHSFWVSHRSPFNSWKTFYRWAEHFTTPAIKYFGALQVKDYSKAIDAEIAPYIEPYLLKYTQKEAGFTSEISEHVIYYEMPDLLQRLAQRLLSDEVVEGSTETIIANNAAAMMMKIHQIENGTVIFESGNYKILSTHKAEIIKEYFKGRKVAIFYYFKNELELLLSVFGESITTDINEFKSTDKHFCIQQISGSEAISLKEADVLVYYNFGYSGKNYTQGRDRLTTKDRAENNVYFFLGKDSLNERIYKAIKAKKKYNEKLFINQYKWEPKANYNQK